MVVKKSCFGRVDFRPKVIAKIASHKLEQKIIQDKKLQDTDNFGATPFRRSVILPTERKPCLNLNLLDLKATQVAQRRNDTQHNGTRHNDTQHNCIQSKDTQHNDIHHNDTQHNKNQHNDTQHNDTQHNDTQHDDTQHNDTQQNDTQHNETQHNTTQYNDT